ncbi:MAG: long-chain-fatty-acid--CoA ligase, partial [Actinomycetota bacterium]|nr:long-chain-fatty-acid--CoA ligase [Actinomycetota bacterium]
MNNAHFEFLPWRAPRTLTLPKTNVFHNLAVSADRYPEKTAIVYYGAEISYRQLRADTEALAGYLQEDLGVEKGDRVLLYMQNSPQFVVAYHAILRANAVVVPVNPMLMTAEIEHYVEDSGARVAILGQELHERLAPLASDEGLAHVVTAAYSDYLQEAPDFDVPEVVTAPARTPEGAIPWSDALGANRTPGLVTTGAEDLACLPYTSGTTGRPKGCMHTHRNLQATLVSAGLWFSMTPETVALATLPMFHVTGMQHSMAAPIYYGGTMILLTRWDRELAASLVEKHGITHWTNISTMVVDFLGNPKIADADLSSLQAVGGGGAPLPAAVGEKLEALTGIRYAEGYGLTETISQTHFNPPDRPKLQCLGIPSFDVDARIVNPETLEELGVGEEGEIVSSGPQIMRGYWNRPEADEETFFERDGRRFMRTGDIAMRDEEGYYFMVDRLKRMINASGYKVWPAEVESMLYGHPAIQEACVIGIPDEQRGETAKAFVVLRDGEDATAED